MEFTIDHKMWETNLSISVETFITFIKENLGALNVLLDHLLDLGVTTVKGDRMVTSALNMETKK